MMILLLITLSPIGFVKVYNDPTQQSVIGLLTQCIITHGLVLMKASHFDFSKDTKGEDEFLSESTDSSSIKKW